MFDSVARLRSISAEILDLREDGLRVGYLECEDFAAAVAAMNATDVRGSRGR